MKAQVLFLLTLISSTFGLFGQNLTVTAPINNNFRSSAIAPNGVNTHSTLRTHFIIPASELQGIPINTVITEIGVNIQEGVSAPASGNLQFYLENTTDVVNNKSANWNNAVSSMTSVYNGPFAPPTTVGPADFVISTPFTYTGGSIYVAYDYAGTTYGNLPAFYWVNTDIPNSARTASTTTSTPLDSVNTLSASRPEIRFTFVNPFTNNLSVTEIRPEYGVGNSFLIDDNDVYVEVLNLGTQTQTNVPINLNLIGSNSYSTSQTITSLAPNASQMLTFNNVPFGAVPNQIIRVTVPSDQQTFNDTLEYSQQISCDSLGYTDLSPATASVGYNTGEGFLGVEYNISNLVPVNIKSIDIRVGNNAASPGNTIKGLLLNSAGTPVDSTLPYTITAGDLGQPLSLPLLNGNVNYANQTVFAGIRQTANPGAGYFPLGTQIQFNPPTNINVSSGVNGGLITYQNTLPPFMVLITVEPRPFIVFADISTEVCAGTPVTIGMFPLAYDNYSIFENNVLLQNNSTGSFTVSPTTTTTYDIVVEKSSCTGQTGNYTVQVVTEYTKTENETFCTGSPYDFNGTLLTASGQYIDTLTSNGGCDSIITLNLVELPTSSSSFSENICAGETFNFAGQDYSTTGAYTDTVPNSVGCDSVITLNLVVDDIDLSISSSGGVLTVGASGPNTTYQWINCDNNLAIPGATAQSFDALSLGITGNYAVQVTQGDCSEQSPCMTIDFTGVEDFIDSDIVIYPNPVVDIMQVDINNDSNITYVIYDLRGRHIQNGFLNKKASHQINVNNLESGTYVIEFKAGSDFGKKLFIKQ